MKVAKKKRAAAPPPTVVASSDAVASAAVDDIVPSKAAADGDAPTNADAMPSVAGEPVVTLGSNCTVKDAVALKQALCAIVATPAAVTLDVRAVERIDTATVQVLCAFVRERLAAALPFNWLGVPQALRDASRLLGVQSLLSLPPAEAAP